MLLHSFRKSKRTIATFCLLNILTQLVTPLKGYSTSLRAFSSGGGTPVAASASSMVDGYTGDFRYSVPLVTVPGPNGESIPVSVGYKAGIGVNQKASWIGLGWDYNPGEITRQVVGAPDDHNGKETYESRNEYLSWYNKRTAKFGSLYNNNINNIPTFDNSSNGWKESDFKTINYSISEGTRCGLIATAQSSPVGSGSNTWNCYSGVWDPSSNNEYRFKRHSAPHTSLAYDQYYVSGGLSGTIKPYFLGSINIYKDKWYNTTGLAVNNRKAQFHFENSNAEIVSQSTYTNSAYVNQSTNQIHSGVRVRYFTNAEINNNANLYNASVTSGYLNYQPITNTSTVRRPTTHHDPDLIGAFQVTDASGVTYHYSLPVYSFDEINYNWSNNSTYLHHSPKQYASSWKLTAITGVDYEDINGNYTPDEGDKGYWIAYNYSLWSNDYFWSSMRYGFKSDALISPKMTSFAQSSAHFQRYSKQNSVSKGHSQVYALNYIKTASHTAFFVKSIRKDEQSYNNIYNPSNKPIASLKLDKIVLLRNEDKALLINSTSLGGSDLDSRFDYATCSAALNDVNFVNTTRYNTNKVAIDDLALKTVELVTDYSLAKKYTGNINNSYTTTNEYGSSSYNAVNGNNIVCKNINSVTSPADNTSGKLTLKKINFYDLKSEKITPSIDFGYDETNPLKNPDFNGDKYDLWGYYKKDYVNSHYITMASKDDVDAWSLKEINTALGGKIKIQYESDMYHKEGFNDEPLHYDIPAFETGSRPAVSCSKPHLIFPISSTDQSNNIINYYDADVSASISGSTGNNYLVLNAIGKCTPAAIIYDGGNSVYYPPATKRLIRWGNSIGSFIGIQPEYHMENGCTGTNFYSQEFTTAYGVNYLAQFREYLYGGGVRVKQIDIVEPFKNDTYSQKFTYGAGYCPVVPKPMCFSSVSGPSNFDLTFNNKISINSSLNGLVGYDTFTQTSVNQNGENLGSIVQSYNNSIISNPINLSGNPRIYINYLNNEQVCQFAPGGVPGGPSCGTTSVGSFMPPSGSNPIRRMFPRIYLDLALGNNNILLLGKLSKKEVLNSDENVVNSVSYQYETYNYINEKFSNKIHESDMFSDYFKRTISGGAYSGCQAIIKATGTDTYIYDYSEVSNYSCYLKNTITTKDGITFSNEIKQRDPYTGIPVVSYKWDPTLSDFKHYTTSAYNNSAYTNLGLKTVNEAYKNQPSLTLESKTIKRNKFIIDHSYVTYSNSYPTRSFDPGADKYMVTTPIKSWYRLDETYNRLLDDDVLEGTAPITTDWRKTSTGTLYDLENNRIEEMGLNDRKTASKWGYNNRYKLADISNANYNSFAFSSFEDQFVPAPGKIHFGGEIINGNLRSSVTVSGTLIKPHTGYYFASVPPNTTGPKFNSEKFEVGRTYIAKVWVHKNSPASASLNIILNGTYGPAHTPLSVSKTITRSDLSNITVGDWVLMTTEVMVPEDFNVNAAHNLSVYTHNIDTETTNAYFDDLSFHPKDAVITGNVYNEKTGLLIAQLDNENFATLYNYDNAGRIVTTYKEYSGGTKKVTENTYHFAKP
jgi:hypothetical protein